MEVVVNNVPIVVLGVQPVHFKTMKLCALIMSLDIPNAASAAIIVVLSYSGIHVPILVSFVNSLLLHLLT